MNNQKEIVLSEKITLIATGGTLEKTYQPTKGEMGFEGSLLHRLLKVTRHTLPLEIVECMQIDSLEMTDAHREKIYAACIASKNELIIITHGTDTMPETASFLSGRIKDKTIILTGAMIPATVEKTDALFNIGTAMAFVQTLEKGIYIAMNGRIFKAGKVAKDKKRGIFITI